MTGRAIVTLAAAATFAVATLAAQAPSLTEPSTLTESAPATYRARFETSKGPFVIAVTREWAPLAADRFYNLVKHGFYDGTRFFRVLDGFMAQWGLHGDPEIQRVWQSAPLADEPAKQSNRRGFVSFTQESGRPNSRYTMVFINLVNNEYLDKSGFAPFGQVVDGMDVVEKLYSGYGRQNQPDQRRILREGNAYLADSYPMLDYVTKAAIQAPPAQTRPPAGRRGSRSSR